MINTKKFVFDSDVWKLLPDLTGCTSLWALELRDIEKKTVSFGVLDAEKESILWANTPPVADWWTSLVSFNGVCLLLETYDSPDVPVPSSLFAISAPEGEVLWAIPRHRLAGIPGRERVAVREAYGEGKVLRVVDVNSGLFLQGSPDNVLQDAPRPVLPVVYKEGDAFFADICNYLYKSVKAENVRLVEYMEVEPYMVISYYIYENTLSIQYLLIVHRFNGVMHHQAINEEFEQVANSLIAVSGRILAVAGRGNQVMLYRLEEEL